MFYLFFNISLFVRRLILSTVFSINKRFEEKLKFNMESAIGSYEKTERQREREKKLNLHTYIHTYIRKQKPERRRQIEKQQTEERRLE